MDDHNINHWINMPSSIYQHVKMDPRLLEKNWIFNFKVLQFSKVNWTQRKHRKI